MIALSGRILSNVCSVALLVNIGITRSLGSFPFPRVLGLNVALLALRGTWILAAALGFHD